MTARDTQFLPTYPFSSPSMSLSTMPKLNEDILRLILDFLPVETLDTMASIHPVFYEARMESRYATVKLIKRDKDLKRLLSHLSEEWVARHVKTVEIRPWLVDPRRKSSRSLTENVLMRCMEVLDPHYTKKTAEQRLQKRLRKDTTMVQAAFAAMENVKGYTIQWDDNANYHPEFYRTFLTPPLEAWASHLVALSICAPPLMINTLARIRLPHLETFEFQFSTANLPSKEIANIHDGFVVFVNNLKDSLTSLKFSSTNTSQNLDLSRIFRMMGTFPTLRRVALSIPFDGGHLTDPLSFAQFLSKHASSLKEFSLLTSRCTVHFKPGDPEHINWIQHILASIHKPFPLLRGLEIALRPLRAPLDILVAFLDMHTSTLQSVSLTDRTLDIDELERLFSYPPAIAEGIQELHIKVDALSAAFLARVARFLPNLKTLKLECARIEIDRTCLRRPLSSRSGRPTEFFMNLNEYRHAINDWGIQHLAIGPSEHNWVRIIERDLVHYLPNLKVTSFTS